MHANFRRPIADDRSPISLSTLRSATGTAVLTATILASAVAALGASVIRVAVPAIGRDFNANVATLQWTVTGYLLTTAALLLLAGALADRFGRKRILIIGLWVTLLASVLCTIAPTVETLIAARLLQGVGGALVTPTSSALLNASLRVADRARAIGLWVGIETLLTSIGPYIGGWFVDQVSWRAIFLLNVLPALIANLALELAPVRVNLIAPGFVDTSLSAALLGERLEERRQKLRASLPIGRVVGPTGVAALAVHLMINSALTGATYDVDGGQQLVSA